MLAEVKSPQQPPELVSEVSDEDEEPADTPRDKELYRLKDKKAILEKHVEELHNTVKKFPYTNFDQGKPANKKPCVFYKGDHYHDYCTALKEGDERWEFAWDYGLCKTRLERDCEAEDRCPHSQRQCYYCTRVKETPFADMIFALDHHSALCTIPDSKRQARKRLENTREELKKTNQAIAGRLKEKKIAAAE